MSYIFLFIFRLLINYVVKCDYLFLKSHLNSYQSYREIFPFQFLSQLSFFCKLFFNSLSLFHQSICFGVTSVPMLRALGLVSSTSFAISSSLIQLPSPLCRAELVGKILFSLWQLRNKICLIISDFHPLTFR